MWTRQEVKRKGKTAFFASYWKFVLVALIIGAVSGGAGGVSSGFSSASANMGSAFGNIGSNKADDQDFDLEDEPDLNIDGVDESGSAHISIDDGKISINGENTDGDFDVNIDNGKVTINGTSEDGEKIDFALDPRMSTVVIDGKEIDIARPTAAAVAGVAIAVAIVVALISFIVGAFTIALDIFVLNPIEYGTQKFLRKAQNGNESLGTVFNGFKDGYRNIVKVMFFRDLFIFLWSLLFIIPGIVKSYEYRMVPFILSENPGMSKDEALKASSRMMYGQKWKTFVLDLSFIGWNLLSLLTLGILGVFYVAPYAHSTNAALYETLKSENAETVVAQS